MKQFRWIPIFVALASTVACGGANTEPEDARRAQTLDSSSMQSGGNRVAQAADRWDCRDTIGVDAAQRAVEASSERLSQCYQQVTDGTKPPEGRLVVQARVSADGRVTDILSGGSLREPRVAGCMARVVASWTFERASEHSCAVVTVPFRFGRQRTYWLNDG